MIEFRVLGPLQVVTGSRVLPLGGMKQRGLLALLLLDRNRVVPRERLIDALWGEQPPPSAANSIQVYVSKLRHLLEDNESGHGAVLATEPPGYVLRIPTGMLDADEFERLLVKGKAALAAGSFSEAEAILASALAVWRGPALADLAAELFAQPEIARLEGLRLDALETRFEAMLAVGRQAEAVGELQTLVGLHPLDERLRAQLMRALYRCGRQAEALETYRAFRRLMSEELGLEPSSELRELEQAILRQDGSLRPAGSADRSPTEPTRAAPATPSDFVEDRPLTVLVADVVGRTALDKGLEAEEARALEDECLTVMGRAVEEYGGTVRERREHAITAHFGAPAAHEDDPERAVRAAARILDLVNAYSRDIEAAWGVPSFGVRAGIETGMAPDETETIAARLDVVAEPGAILVGPTTAHRVAHRFTCEVLGPIEVDGRKEEVSAFRLGTAREPAPGPSRARLLGREGELGRLEEVVRGLESGRGQVVLLLGGPGTGKTRLLAELRSLVAERATWHEGECHSYGGVPCWAFAQILLRWLGAEIGEPAIALRTKIRARLGALLDEEAESVLGALATLVRLRLEPPVEATSESVARAYIRWLEAQARERPVVVAVEDAHWADRPTRELAEAVLELTDRAPVALVLTEEPMPGSEGAALRSLALADYGHRTIELTLGPISDAAARELLADVVGKVDARTRARLVREAEGNPFYLEELGRAYMEGALEPGGRTWTLTMGAHELLPPTLENLLVARIDRQRDGPRRLAQIAAAIGRTFPVRVLETVAGEPVEAALTALMRAEIVRELRRYPELVCAFTNGLLREAALSTLSPARSRSVHAAIAGAYESLYAESLDTHFERLAHYHAQAGNLPRALEYAERARAGSDAS